MPLCAHECWPGGQWTDPVHALTVAHEATADLTASTEEQAPPSPLDETSRQARLARRRRAVQLQRVSARTRLCQAVAREQKVAAARGLPAREQRPELPPSEWRDLLLRRRLRRPDVLVGAHPAPDQMFWSRRAMSPARGPALVPALDDGVAATTMFSARSPLLRVRAPAEPASRPLDSGVADDDAGAARSSAQHAEMSLRFSGPPLLQAMSKPPCSDPALFASLSRQELGALPHARPPPLPPLSREVSPCLQACMWRHAILQFIQRHAYAARAHTPMHGHAHTQIASVRLRGCKADCGAYLQPASPIQPTLGCLAGFAALPTDGAPATVSVFGVGGVSRAGLHLWCLAPACCLLLRITCAYAPGRTCENACVRAGIHAQFSGCA